MRGTLDLARLEKVQHDLVVGHQHETRLVHDGRVVQLFVRVSRRQDRNGGLVDGRPAHACVEITRRKRCGRNASEPGSQLTRVHEGKTLAHILGRESPCKVQRGARDVSVGVDAAGEYDQAARIDRAPAFSVRSVVRHDLAIGDADVLDDTVDPVRRVIDLPAGYPQHARRLPPEIEILPFFFVRLPLTMRPRSR